ncbi:MAG: serine/threonine protein kinase [Rudaea sp.]
METIMELDDFKSAWQTLDQHLQRSNAINLQLFRERRLDKIQSSLRPLVWGLILQLLFGVGFVLLAAMLWMTPPHALPVIAAGVIVHAYGIVCIVMAGITLGQIHGIDYAMPVLEIQKQLAKVRRTYILGGMIVGLPWWFLWVPVLMVLLGLAGVNLYSHAPSVILIGSGVGAAGLLATWWFHRWSRSPDRPRLARAMDAAVTGRSLRRAQAQLEELKRFEQE